jgi:choline monooxygenase
MPKIWKNEPFVAEPSRAQTLDASWYLDPTVYDLEMERIFARTWQPVAKLKDVAEIGDYVATDAAGEPILVTRDTKNRIRAYYNVCPHRAGALARGCGNRKSIQCTYHGWTFDLDGRLMNTPYFFEVEDFNPADFNLREIRVDTWGPYVFVNLDDNSPGLREWWGDEFDRIRGINWDEWHLVDEREYVIDVNWKVYMDNYAEGYHVATAHPGLHREMSLDDLYVDTYRFYSTQRAEIKPPYVGNPYKRRYVNPKPGDSINYHVMFPNFMIDDYPDNISTNIVKPLGHEKIVLKFDWWFKDDANQEMMDSMIEFADQVQQEDIDICNDVQRNLKSRVYDVGRFSGRYENGVHHFHALVHAFVNNPDCLPGFSMPSMNNSHP